VENEIVGHVKLIVKWRVIGIATIPHFSPLIVWEFILFVGIKKQSKNSFLDVCDFLYWCTIAYSLPPYQVPKAFLVLHSPYCVVLLPLLYIHHCCIPTTISLLLFIYHTIPIIPYCCLYTTLSPLFPTVVSTPRHTVVTVQQPAK
jgi:hypothetical protein